MAIKFRHGEYFASVDKMIFDRWREGIITTAQACKEMAENNRLQSVGENEFLDTAYKLGYFQEGPKEDY